MVKTRMHSGRVVVTFTPKVNFTSPPTVSLDNSVYEWREIVDIRDLNKMCFTIPYHGFRSYRPTFDSFESLGTVTIHVLDELVAPSTASQTLEIVCWVSAAEGFELAVPKRFEAMPLVGLPVIATPQSAFGNEPGKNLFCSNIGNSISAIDKDNEHARKCIGERVTSLRQLLRVSRILTTDIIRSDSTAAFIVNPFIFPVFRYDAGSIVSPMFYGDMMSTLGSIFALSRGGVRIKFIDKNLAGISYSYLYTDPSQGLVEGMYIQSQTPIPYSGDLSNTVFSLSDTRDRMGTEVTVPAYGSCHSRSNAAALCTDDVGIYVNSSIPPVFLRQFTTSTRTVNMVRSGADDFDMGLFVSIPPMFFS